MSCCLNTCSVRDMAEQKAIGKMGMLARLREARPEMVFGYLGCMAQSRGAELVKGLGHVDLVVGTQKFHRVADYVDEILAQRRERSMDDPRFSIVDTGGRGRLAGDDPRSHAGAAAGDGVRLHHARVQHALHVLHRALHARGGAEPGHRRRSWRR